MNKQVKLSTQPVKNEKLDIINAVVDIPFGTPDIKALTPLMHIRVVLYLSDGNQFERHFDFIPDCSIDKYVQITVSIFNQLHDDSLNQAK